MENNEAKQKAKELIDYFSSIIPIEASFNDTADEAIRKMRNDWIATKQCAIKVCDEIIDNNNAVPMAMFTMYLINNTLFYKQVKKEIENYEQ